MNQEKKYKMWSGSSYFLYSILKRTAAIKYRPVGGVSFLQHLGYLFNQEPVKHSSIVIGQNQPNQILPTTRFVGGCY